MCAKKMDKSAHEPGWGEVIVGVVLSVALGAVLGVLALVVKPVIQAKELPKDPVAGATYYLEGSRDAAKAKQAAAKRKSFVLGGSVAVIEDEINSFITPTAPPPPPAAKPKPGEKAPPAAAAPAASADTLAIGGPNFRIRDGVVQIGVTVTVNLLGIAQPLVAVARGSFVKRGEEFAFVPETFYVGALPVHRLPFAADYLTRKFFNAKSVPEDVATAWGKLSSVAVEGNTLKLTMP
jgi:hypothetical protein